VVAVAGDEVVGVAGEVGELLEAASRAVVGGEWRRAVEKRPRCV
jgi:hypothetical protein